MARQLLEILLRKDDQEWIIEEDCWKIFWGDKKKSKEYDVDLIVQQNKGFILIRKYKGEGRIDKDIKNYIKFAFVYSKFRRQGIMKKLMKRVDEKYPNESLSLYSMNVDSDQVWEYFGFECIGEVEINDYFIYILEK